MDYNRDRKSNISFSLHDSRILQIEINEDKLSLNMDRIFQYTDNEEKWYKGIIEFTNIDKEECNIMVFNAPYGYNEVKSFSGKELSFDEFKEQYPNAEFEIVTEGYCGYDISNLTTSSLEVHDDNKNCYNFTDGSVLHLLFCKAD